MRVAHVHSIARHLHHLPRSTASRVVMATAANPTSEVERDLTLFSDTHLGEGRTRKGGREEGGTEGGREGGRRDGRREGGKEGGREGGREEGRKGVEGREEEWK